MVLEPASLRDGHSAMMFFGPSVTQSLGGPISGNMVNATESIDNHEPGSAGGRTGRMLNVEK